MDSVLRRAGSASQRGHGVGVGVGGCDAGTSGRMVGRGRDVVGGGGFELCALLGKCWHHIRSTPKAASTQSSRPPQADRLGITARDRSLFHACVLLLLRRFFVGKADPVFHKWLALTGSSE
jgi:hypothetical protein